MKANRAERVSTFLRARPLEWIRATAFESIGGRQAWRTAIAEARLQLEAQGEGTIENRQSVRTCQTTEGGTYRVSEYRFKPNWVQPGFAWDQEHTA